jgi:hypothetical protein
MHSLDIGGRNDDGVESSEERHPETQHHRVE